MKFQTRLLHGKAVDTYANGATVPPVSFANAFAYETSEQLEKVFQNRAPGFAYSRIANPTVDAFERRVNELEGGIGGVACSSGMSAVTLFPSYAEYRTAPLPHPDRYRGSASDAARSP